MKRGQENMQKTVLTNSLESANAGKTREEVKKLRVKQNKAFNAAMKTLKSKSYDELKDERLSYRSTRFQNRHQEGPGRPG